MFGDFHHLGIACRNLDTLTRDYQLLGYEVEAPDFDDPIQRVRGRFLIGPGPRVELLVASAGSQVLDPWLNNGPRIYHLAYEVENLSLATQQLTDAGARVVVPAVPAVAFGGRPISFIMLRSMQLIELIAGHEKTSAAPEAG